MGLVTFVPVQTDIQISRYLFLALELIIHT